MIKFPRLRRRRVTAVPAVAAPVHRPTLDEMRDQLAYLARLKMPPSPYTLHTIALAMLTGVNVAAYPTAQDAVIEYRRILGALDHLLAAERADHTDRVVTALRAA